MAIRSGTFYWLVCDKCGYRMEDEFGALYHSTKELLELAESYGWDIDGDRHLCPDCAEDEQFAEIYGEDEDEGR